MQTENKIETFEEQDWTVNYQTPEKPETAPVLLLLHGWTGDERVMWIFTRSLARHFWMFAPRAPISVASGGYAWLPHKDSEWPTLPKFKPATISLLEAVQQWGKRVGTPETALNKPYNLMGFSQGAAMSYSLAAYHPERIGRVAALAGFLPQGEPERLKAFDGKQVYIAHGTRDDIVPVQKAEEAVQSLQAAGADVTFCESPVGHKLSASCLRGLDSFLLD